MTINGICYRNVIRDLTAFDALSACIGHGCEHLMAEILRVAPNGPKIVMHLAITMHSRFDTEAAAENNEGQRAVRKMRAVARFNDS